MKNAKALNLKNMKEALVNYANDNDEMNKTWDALYRMACIGFIDSDTWEKFTGQCQGWYIGEDCDCVRDSRNCDAVVWAYAPDAEYRA